MSWAERARAPGTATSGNATSRSLSAGRRAVLASAASVADQTNRRNAPLQQPKGVRAAERQLQRWGEVAFAFH